VCSDAEPRPASKRFCAMLKKRARVIEADKTEDRRMQQVVIESAAEFIAKLGGKYAGNRERIMTTMSQDEFLDFQAVHDLSDPGVLYRIHLFGAFSDRNEGLFQTEFDEHLKQPNDFAVLYSRLIKHYDSVQVTPPNEVNGFVDLERVSRDADAVDQLNAFFEDTETLKIWETYAKVYPGGGIYPTDLKGRLRDYLLIYAKHFGEYYDRVSISERKKPEMEAKLKSSGVPVVLRGSKGKRNVIFKYNAKKTVNMLRLSEHMYENKELPEEYEFKKFFI
jgi:hypothetical protein